MPWTIPEQEALLAFLRRPTAERGRIVARMGLHERAAWELAWTKYAPEQRGAVTDARAAFDSWVKTACDALMEREVGG